MARLIKNIIWIISLIFITDLQGQSQYFENIPTEEIATNTSANLLLSGENLYYNIWCFNSHTKKHSLISKIAYVLLIDSNKNIVSNQKIRLEKGIGNGVIYMPTNLKTGQYKLVSFTKWMLNNDSQHYNAQDIYILNPYLSSKTEPLNAIKDSIYLKKTYDEKEQIIDSGIKISVPTSNFKKRNKVSFDIENLNNDFISLSISVRKKEDIFVNKSIQKENLSFLNHDYYFIPELRGEIVSGKIINKQTQKEEADKIVSLSITGNQHIFKTVKTNKQGEFYFNLHETYKTGELILQVLDLKPEDFEILIDNFEFPYSEELDFKAVEVNSEIEEWLINRSIYSQIENAYFKINTDTTHTQPVFKLFGQPEKNYVLDEYTRFPSVEKTLIEVIENVGIKKHQEEKKINIITFDQKDIYTADFENFVVIDGIPVLKHDYLFQLNAERIHSISIYKDLFLQGQLIYNKIMLVNTKKNDFTLPDFAPQLKDKIISPENYNLFSGPDYSKGGFERIPDFRTQLFWVATGETNDTKQNFAFYTSDVTGVFEIKVKGYFENGKTIELIKYISVD